MKRFVPPLAVFFFLLSACSDSGVRRVSNEDSVRVTPAAVIDSNLVLNAPEMYDSQFVKDILYSGFAKSYRLEKEKMIFDETQEITFPVDMELNKMYTLKGCKEGRCFTLYVKRTNNTGLQYSVTEYKEEKDIWSHSGRAILVPGFFLASETEESADGESFPVSTYIDDQECYGEVRIGKLPDGKIGGMFLRKCNDGSEEISPGEAILLVHQE